MTIAILIYLVGLLTPLSIFFSAIGFVAGFIAVIYAICWGITRDGLSEKMKWGKLGTCLVSIAFLSCFVNALIPSEKTAWLMLAGYTAQTVYESEEGQQYRKLINKRVQEALGETAEQEKKGK